MKNIYFLIGAVAMMALSNHTKGQVKEIQNFTLTNVLDNKPVSLSDYKDKKGLVVIFTSNSCPYDKYYQKRISLLAIQCNESGIPFLLINSGKATEESESNMVKAAKAAQYKMPYLSDKSLKALNIFEAKKSPEAFLLKIINDKFYVVYHGAIDNNPQVPSDVKENYLLSGIEKLLAGKAPETNYVRPTGCIIKRF